MEEIPDERVDSNTISMIPLVDYMNNDLKLIEFNTKQKENF